MKENIDADEILKELSRKPDRERISLYISRSLYAQFRKDCGNIAPSQVMEVLMRRFSDSKKRKEKTKGKTP